MDVSRSTSSSLCSRSDTSTTPLCAVVPQGAMFSMYATGWKDSYFQICDKVQMQRIHTKHLFLRLCSSYHLRQLILARCWMKLLPSKDQSSLLRSALVDRLMHCPHLVHASLILIPVVFLTLCMNKSVQRVSVLKADCKILFAWYSNLYSSTLYSLYSSVFFTNNAEVHTCMIYLIVSGGATWPDDQIGLVAFICMFLLESRLWQEIKLIHPTQ